ncbi:MAG: hypothetical protein M3017_11880 [Actinomycetota bacterium]|nr:hypothetical protein [Actinomycetota bacterium]
MAIAVVLDFTGATLEQYDQVVEKMNLTPGGQGPGGLLSHWVTATDGGIRISDVWQTREVFDAWAQDKIGPLTVEVGFPAPPEMTFYDVHNYLTAGPAT